MLKNLVQQGYGVALRLSGELVVAETYKLIRAIDPPPKRPDRPISSDAAIEPSRLRIPVGHDPVRLVKKESPGWSH